MLENQLEHHYFQTVATQTQVENCTSDHQDPVLVNLGYMKCFHANQNGGLQVTDGHSQTISVYYVTFR